MTFLGFFSGYVMGYYGMNLSFENSLILSLVVGILTIFLETFLMIFRIYKSEIQSDKAQKKQKTEFDVLKSLGDNKPKSKLEEILEKSTKKQNRVAPVKSDLDKKND